MSRAFLASRLGLLFGAAVALPVLAACLEHPLKPVEYDKAQEIDDNIALTVNKDVDILFVIDNSGSMGEEQGTLAKNFDAFINVLEREDVKANYRVGITTTDNGNPWCPGGDGGAMRVSSCQQRLQDFVFAPMTAREVDKQQAACLDVCLHEDIQVTATSIRADDAARPRPWLESIEGKTNLPEGVSTVEAFQCFGPQGINGCGFESHLESMYKALKRTEVENEPAFGFLRRNAILAVVFLTDEVDCSFKQSHRDIFLPEGMRTFWSDPNAASPTSAVCWNAGVLCTGSGGIYDSCTAENYDEAGNVGVPDDEAVLQPISRYIDLLQAFEDQKQEISPNAEVLVALIAGVPPGYEDGGTEIVYQDAPGDPVFQDDYGIGPGCVTTEGKAAPPVRERQFAEWFEVDRRNIYSICDADYSKALGSIADAIADQIRPACFPRCAADGDPATPDTLEPNCNLEEEVPMETGLVTRPIPPCVIAGDAWDFPSAGDNVCFRVLTDQGARGAGATATTIDDMTPLCVEEGWNLEFALERREGFPAPSGTSVRATCALSENKAVDCPGL